MVIVEVKDVKIRRASDIEQAMREADASLRAEGLYVTEEENNLIRKKLMGEISHKEFLSRALELAKGHE